MLFKTLSTVLFLLVFPLSVLAAPALMADGQEYDFGAIQQGESVPHTFRFQNAGDEVLEITSVRTSCGCTAALLSSRRLAPGEVGELELTFNSQGFRGKIHKTIEMTTNDPQQPLVIFHLRGSVKLQLFASPERVNWGTVKVVEPLTAQVLIKNLSDQKISLKSVKIVGKGILATVSADEIQPNGQVTIDIKAEFPDNGKRLSGYIIIPTDSTLVPQIRVPVSARLSKN